LKNCEDYSGASSSEKQTGTMFRLFYLSWIVLLPLLKLAVKRRAAQRGQSGKGRGYEKGAKWSEWKVTISILCKEK
jgi:hypothetical protein